MPKNIFDPLYPQTYNCQFTLIGCEHKMSYQSNSTASDIESYLAKLARYLEEQQGLINWYRDWFDVEYQIKLHPENAIDVRYRQKFNKYLTHSQTINACLGFFANIERICFYYLDWLTSDFDVSSPVMIDLEFKLSEVYNATLSIIDYLDEVVAKRDPVNSNQINTRTIYRDLRLLASRWNRLLVMVKEIIAAMNEL